MSSHRAGPAHFVSLTLAVPVLLLAAAHPTAAVADALPPQIYTPDSQGLATSDGFTAVLHNPAGIGIRGTGVYLGATQMESRWSTASVFGQAGALAIGYQHWSGDFFGVNRDQYVVGHAIRLSRAARIGFSCSGWRAGAGPVRAATSWGAGLLIRPVGWLSLAAKIDDINRPRFGDGLIPRIYRAGVALRPRTTRLTLTFDAASDVFDDWADAEFRWGAQIEPVDGLLLGASVDREGTFHVGLGINGRRTGAGALVSRTEDAASTGGSGYLEFSDRINRTCFSRTRHVAKFSLSGRYRDEPSEAAFSLSSHRGASSLLSAIRTAVDDESVSGIRIDIWGFSNLALAQEIRDEMLLAGKRGKKVVVYMAGGGSLTDYLVASTADTIIMPETTRLGPFGLMTRTQMLKGLMDKLGFEFERYPCRRCDYKSAYFQLTEDEVPDLFREEMNSILDDWFDQLITDISAQRGLERDTFESLCDGGYVMAPEAKEEGLVDVLAYSDIADSLTNQMTRSRIVDGMRLAREKPRDYGWVKRPAVAVIAAMGSIGVGENRSGFTDGNVIGSETLVRTIRNAQNNPDVKAVVLRIDSPGGSGYASDMIWHQIEDLKRRTRKPIVSSMGIMAASGGYYIAMNSDKIFADPGTLTGSIGVTGMKTVTAGMYSKIGVRNEIFKRGEHVDMFGTNRRTTDEEREKILDMVDHFYDIFTSKAAEGRGKAVDEVFRLGGGRVYTGRQARANGLVDRLGGVREAVELAAEMAAVGEDYRVVYYHRPKKSLWQRVKSFGSVETPVLDTIFNTPGPMTYSELAEAMSEVQ